MTGREKFELVLLVALAVIVAGGFVAIALKNGV
jgi:hypothetical protein